MNERERNIEGVCETYRESDRERDKTELSHTMEMPNIIGLSCR